MNTETKPSACKPGWILFKIRSIDPNPPTGWHRYDTDVVAHDPEFAAFARGISWIEEWIEDFVDLELPGAFMVEGVAGSDEEDTWDFALCRRASAKELHKHDPFVCIDCGVHTSMINEYYMVHDHVWHTAGMAEDGGMLCIGCLEKHLGRELNSTDFTHAPINAISRQSARLADRLARPAPKTYPSGGLLKTRINDWHLVDGGDVELTPAQRQPWTVTLSRGGYGGLFLEFDAVDGTKRLASIEIDKGNVTILASRRDGGDPDAKMIITEAGVHVESSVERQLDRHALFNEDGLQVVIETIPEGLHGPVEGSR